MDFLLLALAVIGFSAAGFAVASWFMFKWVKKIIDCYVEKVFHAEYKEFIHKFAKLYRLHDFQIKELQNDRDNRKTG